MGVLYDLGRKDLLQTLMRSGLSPLRKLDLEKIMEAAVIESHHSTRSIIVTGLEMFERIDGKLVGTQDQTQLYWTEVPEFGFLQEHRLSDAKGRADTELNLREQIQKLDEKKGHAALLDAFIAFISQLLGFSVSTFNSVSSLATYGLDSLSAVSCQYWFHRGKLFPDIQWQMLNQCRGVYRCFCRRCSQRSIDKPAHYASLHEVFGLILLKI